MKLRRTRLLTASVTIALWLFAGFLSVAPHWHHCLHEDSQSAQHQCLVTKFSDGDLLDNATPALLSGLSARPDAPAASPGISGLTPSDRLLPPGRAPPIA